jgi:hypothetical protein
VLAAVVAVGALIAGGRSAEAQYVAYGPFEVYPTQLYREGPGFRVLGDGLVLHPGLQADLGYDSNVLMSSQAGQAGVFRLLGHLDLATLPPQRLAGGPPPRIEFRFGAGIEYRQFFSRDSRVGSSRQVNAQSDANLVLWSGDPLSLRAFNQFLVTNDARNLEIANSQTFAPRIYDRFGAVVRFRPRQGPLEVGLGESFRVDHYVQSELARSRSLSNDLNLYGQLRVLPETLVRLDIRSSYVSFYGDGAPIPASAPLRLTAGAQSMLLPWLGASLYLGYGNSLHYGLPAATAVGATLVGDIGAARYSNFVGGLEARLRIRPRLRLNAGWSRDFFDSIYATYLRDDRIYVNYEQDIWRGIRVRSSFETYVRQYGTLVVPSTLQYRAYRNGATSRSDVLVSFAAEASYRPLAFLEVGVSYTVLDDVTDFGFIDGAGTPSDAAFVKHVLLLKADFAY